MKRTISLLLALCVIALFPLSAHLESGEPEIFSLVFEGTPRSCQPISFTQDEDGTFVLIMSIEGEDAFVKSQKYKVMSPIYACILDEAGKPLMPSRVRWHSEVPDGCLFTYEVDEMPETLAVIPLDAVEDPSAWYTLTLADIPTETPAAYIYPEESE